MLPPTDPSYNHQYVTINGVRMHFIDVGPRDAVPVVLVHGFPDLWWGWRNQIKALRESYRVIAADNRGFGETDAPKHRESYRRKIIAQDYASLLDYLQLEKAVFVGHDWGADFVWKMCLFQPHRVLAVAALCSPYFPRAPKHIPLEQLAQAIPSLQYQLFFNEPETPEHLDRNIDKLLNLMFKAPLTESRGTFTDNLKAVDSLTFSAPTSIMPQQDFEYYASSYRKRGIAGALNWYKVLDLDWEDLGEATSSIIPHKALFIAAGKDIALPVSLSNGMERLVPNLTRVLIDDASHWVLWDSADQVNEALLEWLPKSNDLN